MKVINFFSGPGSGKSALAAGLFYEMKKRDYNVELVTEYAKSLVWSNRIDMLFHQDYLFAKQRHAIERLRQHNIDYCITDSPILFCAEYAPEDFPARECFRNFVFEMFEFYDNINFFIIRNKKYIEKGRTQGEEEAKIIDNRMRSLLNDNEIPYINISYNIKPDEILKMVDSFQ